MSSSPNLTLAALLSRIDLAKLYPPFLALAEELIGELLQCDEIFYATSGVRSFADQDLLYTKGRTAPGGKVTNARAGFSAHQYGIAIDFTKDTDPDRIGLQPTWQASEYQALADKAKLIGLEPGFYWLSLMDAPHIQLPLTFAGLTLTHLRDIYLSDGGQPAVWNYLDGFRWNRNLVS